MTYSIIQKSQLEGTIRLDAEYYQPEYLEWEKLINKKSFSFLKDIARIKGGKRLPLGESFSETGIPYIRAEDVKNNFVDYSNSPLISEQLHERLDNYQTRQNDVLITIVGNSIGDIGIVKFQLEKCHLTENCAKIIVSKTILPEYLFAFFLSKFGQFQIAREKVGTTQPKLALDRIQKIKLVLPDKIIQETIKEIINQAKTQSDQSKNLYTQAEDLLLEELGLKDFKIENDLFSIVNLSDVQKNNRMDADYYQQKYFKLLDSISAYNHQKLSKFTKRITQNQKLNPDLEYDYTEISDINVSTGELGSNKLPVKELPANAKIPVRGGELIVSKVRPTRGAIAIIPKTISQNHLVSGAFSVFQCDSPAREYLQVVLRSLVGKLQMERPTTGTSYPTITDQDVENILIPVSPPKTQQKIAELVKKSHTARQKSKELLEMAKTKVEELIEATPLR